MKRRLLITLTAIGMLLFGIVAYDAGAHHTLSPASLAAADPTCQTFTQTGHTVCGDFLAYWQNNGGLAQQGYPISDVFDEVSDTDGMTHKVQYFERAVFEAHPENQPPNTVLLSLLGSQKYKAKYPNGTAAAAAAPVAPPAPSAATAVPTVAAPPTAPSPVASVSFLNVQGNAAGHAASVAIQTAPLIACAITYTTPAGTVSSASGLGPKTTTAAGLAVWTWTIDSNTRSGSGTVLVQCGGGLSASTSIKIG